MNNAYDGDYYIWSSGLEKWQPVILSGIEQKELIFQHIKTWNGIKTIILKDNLNRYIMCIESLK